MYLITNNSIENQLVMIFLHVHVRHQCWTNLGIPRMVHNVHVSAKYEVILSYSFEKKRQKKPRTISRGVRAVAREHPIKDASRYVCTKETYYTYQINKTIYDETYM